MTLCDAGPLFALVDPRQAVLHQRCKAALPHLRSPLITTWLSFTEAMYLAHRSGGWPMQNLLWQYVREAVLVFHFGFSRTFDDVGRAGPGCIFAAPLHQAASSTRARSNTNPARPYICRLIIFNRFT